MIDFSDLEIELQEGDDRQGTFRVGPLPKGYGNTFANAFRRILLSSLAGGGVTSLRVAGADHEYATIKGVRETVLHVMLNVKGVRFQCESDEPQTVKLSAKGAKVVTAKDLDVTESVRVLNPDHKIATLTAKDSKLDLEMTVERGIGYRGADEEIRSEAGRLPLDASFSPVERVSFDVQPARKGEQTDLDAVFLKIYTDGSLTPKDAFIGAVSTYKQMLDRFEDVLGAGMKESEKPEAKKSKSKDSGLEAPSGEILDWPIENLELGKRIKSVLLDAKIEKVSDLVGITREELVNIPGIGEAAIKDIMKFLKSNKLELKS